MTSASSAFQTMTRLTAVQLVVEGDSDSDSEYCPLSQHYADVDGTDESIEALIERYTGKRHQLDHADDDTSGRNTFIDDDDDDDDEDDGDKVISKHIVRLKEQQFEAPEFEQRLRGYNETRVGESVTFVAQFKAHPAPTVKWFKDEEEVRPTERHMLESSSSTECVGIIRLIINDVRTTDEGAYKCKVENQEGVASTTGYLSVTGGESRSRSRTARTTSSRTGKLSPSTISSPSRSPGVSTPPILRPITEQKSIEEKEELELSHQPPSPLQSFIDSIRHSAKSRHPPIFYGCEHIFGTVGGDETSGDDEDEDDVFDSEEDSISQTTSIDCMEQLLTLSPTSTSDDVDVCDSPTAITCTFGASLTDYGDTVAAAVTAENVSKKQTETPGLTSYNNFQQLEADFKTRDRQNFSTSTVVPDSPVLSSSTSLKSRLTTTEVETSGRRALSTFHQRRLGQLQLKHRLAIDLPDVPSSTSLPPRVFSDESPASDTGSDVVCDSTSSDDVTLPNIYSCCTDTSMDLDCQLSIGYALRFIQDSMLTLFDNPVAQFYIVFVAVTSALANAFDVQPPWLVLIVSVASFASFQLFNLGSCHRYRQLHDEQSLSHTAVLHVEYSSTTTIASD